MSLQLSATSDSAGLMRIGAALDSRKYLVAIQRTQNLFAGQVINRARHYPPERPNQQYRRTFNLRTGWKVRPSRPVGDDFEVVIYNDAVDTNRRSPKEYAGYVYGFNLQGQGQSIWHVGRWPILGRLADMQSYYRQMQNAIAKVAAGG